MITPETQLMQCWSERDARIATLVKKHGQELSERDARIELLEKKLEEKDARIATLVKKHGQELSERDARIELLERKLEEKDARIVESKTKINMLENDIIPNLQSSVKSLTEDNRRLSKANRKLNAENNNIRTVPDKEPKRTGKVGRPCGGEPTRNMRPKRIDRRETVDVKKCSKNHYLSDKATSYTKVVKVLHVWVENVEYTIIRRWCKKCDKYVSAQPSGVSKHTRTSDNYSSFATWMHMNGFAHGKVMEFFTGVAKDKTSRVWSYRNKIKTAGTLEPEYAAIQQDILDEPYLACDELWWKIPGENGGKVMVARGENMCLANVVLSANKEAVKKMLPGYKGIVGQDSNTIWLHAGSDHQFCMPHQRRLSKKDLLHHIA